MPGPKRADQRINAASGLEGETMEKKRLNLPFTGITSFCKVPVCEEWSKLDTDVAVLGVPFDMSTQAKPGARYGPRGIRDGSAIYSLQDVGYYDHEFDEYFLEGVRIVDCGDVDMIHMDPHRCLQNAYEAALEIVSKDVLLVAGKATAIPCLASPRWDMSPELHRSASGDRAAAVGRILTTPGPMDPKLSGLGSSGAWGPKRW